MATSKKQIIEKVNQAFVDNKMEDFLKLCKEDVTWTMVGHPATEGKAAIRKMLGEMPEMAMTFSPVTILADGDRAVAYGNGTMQPKDGPLENYSFCDIYRFEGDLIAEMNSYMAVLKGEEQAKS